MAEALKPMPLVDGGRVDVSSPNDSGIGGLARALDVTIRSAADIAATAQENEFKQVESLLNDATIGPDEAKEIAGNAFFPINRYNALNRAGEARVAQMRTQIEDELVKATDPVDARMRLRKIQQDLMDGEQDAGVQAGIRQAIADLAGPAINKASAKRVELRNIQRRKDESVIFRETLINDPDGFADQLKAIFGDQSLDATQEPDVHATAAQTMLNLLIEDPDSMGTVREAAQAALDSGTVQNAEDRKQYTAVLSTVNQLEKARASQFSDTDRKNSLKAYWGNELDNWFRTHPNQYPPSEMVEGYKSGHDDPLAAVSKIRTHMEATKGGSVGAIGTQAYADGKKTLDRLFASSPLIVKDEAAREVEAAAYALYDQLVGAMDPNVINDEAVLRQETQALAELAQRQASQYSQEKKIDFEARDARLKEIDELMAAPEPPSFSEWKKLNAEKKKLESGNVLQAQRDALNRVFDLAESMGIHMRDLRQ